MYQGLIRSVKESMQALPEAGKRLIEKGGRNGRREQGREGGSEGAREGGRECLTCTFVHVLKREKGKQ